jgi:hypothetical protein
MTDLIPYANSNPRNMIFVDGENLAIRYGDLLKGRGGVTPQQIEYEPNVLVWPKKIDLIQGKSIFVIRQYYYTSGR